MARRIPILAILTLLPVVPLVVWGIYAIRWDEQHEGEAMGVGTMLGWAAVITAGVLLLLAGIAVLRGRRP